MKKALVTHTDLDGAVSEVMFHLYMRDLRCSGDDIVVYRCSYQDLDRVVDEVLDDLDQFDLVVFADIAPRRHHLLAINSLPESEKDKFVILDHHKHNDWAQMRADLPAVLGVCDKSHCGATLVAQKLLRRTWTPTIRTLLAETEAWDLWKLNDPYRQKGEWLNHLYNFYGHTALVDLLLYGVEAGNYWAEDTRRVVETLERKMQAYVRRCVWHATIRKDREGRTFAFVVANQHPGEVADALMKNDVDYVAVYLSETSSMSLRSAPDKADVGVIARERGGGGHEHSAGYPTRKCPLPVPRHK